MENLVIDLKEKLVLRRKDELNRINELKAETDKDLLLIYSGKVFELEYLIKALEEMMDYQNRIKCILK